MEEASFTRENAMDSTFNANKIDLVKGEDYTDLIYDSIKTGNFEKAIEVLEKFIEMGKWDKATFSVLSYWYYQTGEYEKACHSYKELISIVPDNPQYLFYYAQCLFKISEFSEATKICKKLLRTPLEQEALQL